MVLVSSGARGVAESGRPELWGDIPDVCAERGAGRSVADGLGLIAGEVRGEGLVPREDISEDTFVLPQRPVIKYTGEASAIMVFKGMLDESISKV